MISDTTQERFKGADWYSPEAPPEITIGGIGGIGSWFSIPAYKMGWRLFIYEDLNNRVESTNVGGQLFGEAQYGSDKVGALKKILATTGIVDNYQLVNMYSIFREGFVAFPISVAAFDNMKARKALFEGWKESLKTKSREEPAIFIDPRMTAETGLIYCLKNPSDVERYEADLFTDEEAQELVCSYRATPHCGMRIGSYIAQYICNQISNKVTGEAIRDVPFKTHVNLFTGDSYEH